jgi:hypothetical protein
MFQKNLLPHRRVGEFLLPRSRSEYGDKYHNLLRYLRENSILHSHRRYILEILILLHISTTRFIFNTICMIISTNLNRFIEWRSYHLVVIWRCIIVIRNELCYEEGRRGGGVTKWYFPSKTYRMNVGISARKCFIIRVMYTFCLNWTIRCSLATYVAVNNERNGRCFNKHNIRGGIFPMSVFLRPHENICLQPTKSLRRLEKYS